MVGAVGFEPTRSKAPTDFKSVAWASSATPRSAVPYASGYGREHSLYIPRALCGPSQ